MLKIYIVISALALNLLAANFDAGRIKEIEDNFSQVLPQFIIDFVSTISLGVGGIPFLLLLSAPVLALLYGLYRVIRTYWNRIKTKI